MALSTQLLSSDRASSPARSISSKSLEAMFLKCSVCLDKFDSKERSPRQLQCQHTFCIRCLTSIVENDENGRRRFNYVKCPTCRQLHSFGLGGVQEIPTDHKIVQLMDVLSLAKKESDNTCDRHGQQKLNFFCKTCEVPICRDCTVVSHNQTKDHEVIELGISEALKEFSPQFINTRQGAKQISEKLLARLSTSNKGIEELTENEASKVSQIRKTFAGYHEQLEEREKALLSQLRGYVSGDKEDIENLQKVLHHEVSTYIKLDEQFEEAEKQQDIRKLFDLMHQMKKWETSFTDLANDKDWRKWYEYSPHNENTFRKELGQLGNIDKKSDMPHQEVVSTPDSVSETDNASARTGQVQESIRTGSKNAPGYLIHIHPLNVHAVFP